MSSLSTTRLFLRPLNHNIPSDYDNIIELCNSPFFIKYNGDHGYRTHADVDRKEIAGCVNLALCTGKTPPPKSCYFLAHLKTSGQFIGVISMVHRKPMPPDLGYNFVEEFTNQGYGTEACREVLRFWREDVGVKQIWIGTFLSNSRSQHMAMKLGFVPGGIIIGRMPPSSGLGSIEITAFILPDMKPFPNRFVFDVQPTENAADSGKYIEVE
jgi:[ribosomal protein S5]-alanine N-acetyltransferase